MIIGSVDPLRDDEDSPKEFLTESVAGSPLRIGEVLQTLKSQVRYQQWDLENNLECRISGVEGRILEVINRRKE